MIVPRNHSTWLELVRHLTREHDTHVAWRFKNIYFFDDELGLPREEDVDEVDVPDYLHMMKYIYRSSLYMRRNSKCFIDPERVVTVHNHFPLKCLGEIKCPTFHVSEADAQLQHYRADCAPHLASVCEEEYKEHRVKDTSIFRNKHLVMERVERTLKHLGFIETF